MPVRVNVAVGMCADEDPRKVHCLSTSMEYMKRSPGNWSQGILLRHQKPLDAPLAVVPYEKYPPCMYDKELIDFVKRVAGPQLREFGYDVPEKCKVQASFGDE